jgi:hypothetical protein
MNFPSFLIRDANRRDADFAEVPSEFEESHSGKILEAGPDGRVDRSAEGGDAHTFASANKPLDELALMIGTLTYGEMIELAEKMWAKKQTDGALAESDLPPMLHRWATNA